MKVFYRRGRGVVVTNPVEFRTMFPDLLVHDLKDCRGLRILDCRVRINGEDGPTWAKRWLYKGQGWDRLSTIPCPVAVMKESGFTVKEIVKDLLASHKKPQKEGRCKAQTIHLGRQF